MREVHAPSAERERAAIEGLLEMNQAILSGLPLRRLAVIIGRRAYAVTGASLILTCTPAADGQGLVVRSAIGHQATKLRGWTIPADLAEVGGLPGPQPIALDAEPWRGYLPADISDRMGAGLLVPLRAQERTMGLLLLGHRRAGPMSDDDLKLVELLAAQAALALAYHYSREAMLSIAVKEDHERIVRELHDGIVQKLYGLGMELQATTQPVPHGSTLGLRLEGAISDIDRVVADLRAYMSELRPTLLVDSRLDLGLRRLAADVAKRTHVSVELDIDEHLAARLAEQAQSLLLIASKRLSEVTRRADVTTCRIRLREGEGPAVLEIEDNGRGIHGEAGEWLPNSQEQAAEFNIEVEAMPQAGARFRARILDTQTEDDAER